MVAGGEELVHTLDRFRFCARVDLQDVVEVDVLHAGEAYTSNIDFPPGFG
jgi:hypothetical protein